MKHTTVVFTQSGARVFNNYKPLPFYNKEKVLVNPNVSHMNDTPPMFWKLEHSEIKEMTRPEKLRVLAKIKDTSKAESLTAIIYPLRLHFLCAAILLFLPVSVYFINRLNH
jgi:hypothetical protein